MASVKSFGRQKEVQDPTKVPVGIDSSTFMTPQIPDEVKGLVPLLHQLPAESFAPLLRRVYAFLQDGEMTEAEYHGLQTKEFSSVNFAVMFTGLYTLISLIVRTKAKLSIIAADLAKINMPPTFIDLLVRFIRTARPGLEIIATSRTSHFPRLQHFRWRVDVTISSSSLSRILKPSIMMQVYTG
jgi:hypothetical protein